jgi:antitoxin component YwqK of YwqJK toxin-antitoxin module
MLKNRFSDVNRSENKVAHALDTNLENVCSNGIHYFLNLECAFYYSLKEITNGEYLEWYDNGQQHIKCTYTDGKLNGEYLEWYDNGQQHIKCTYTGGKLNGEFLIWYDNGQQQIKCTFTDGEYLVWNENGQQVLKCTYTDGKFNEEYYKLV